MGGFWVYDFSFEERIVATRYFLFCLSGFIAFAMPYILFPDRKLSVLQLGNIHGKQLRNYLSGKLLRIFAPVLVLISIIYWADFESPAENLLNKFIYSIHATILFVGIVILALVRYVQAGKKSQYWQESEQGKRARIKAAEYFKFPLDSGSIPSLINTTIITTVGMGAVVISAAFEPIVGVWSALGVGFVVLAAAVWMFLKMEDDLTSGFYQSDAFYREFFGENLKGEESEQMRTVDQLWWVPGSLKSHVWQFLVQLDRIIPSGRLVAAGHMLIWFIAYQRPQEEFLLSGWIVFAMAHHLLTFLTFKIEMAPGWILRWIGTAQIWFFTRFWLQLRWLLPLAVSINVQQFIFGTPSYKQQALVAIVYIGTAALVALVGVIQFKREVNT